MKAGLQLRKPENWPDFQTLCKKLWGEIWDCPEIKKNGRLGQKQHGVDIYGIPKGDTEYYGIQCKGKDEYNHRQLTKKEIDEEIEKAKSFQPSLKKFYFATTANKNAKIEEYVRTKDKENRENGLFEIHLFSWEDIVELIDENKQTHDWYLKSQGFKSAPKARVTFENDSEEIEIVVPFIKKTIHYQRRPNQLTNGLLAELFALKNAIESSSVRRNPLINPGFDESYCRFRICLENTGSVVIENYKVFLYFHGDFQSVETCFKGSFLSPNPIYNTFIEQEEKRGVFKPLPSQDPLVQKDNTCSDTICLKPIAEKPSEVFIYWQIVAKDYNDEGKLLLRIKPEIKTKEETIYIDDVSEEKIEERIEDFIT